MVHALRDIWRVLAPGGILLDLRPLARYSPVKVISGGRVRRAGRLEVLPESGDDDRAADAALRNVEQEGMFARERDGAFDFTWYWDTIDEMRAYLAERWTDTRLPGDVLAEMQRLMAHADAEVKVSVSGRVVISRWRRLMP